MCRACSGDAVKVKNKKVQPRGCDECVAESLIKNGEYEDDEYHYTYTDNTFRVTDLEGAKKLCSCFRNHHQGGINSQISEEFLKTNDKFRKFSKKEKEEQESLVFYNDKKKQDEIDYYQNRIQELKKLDEEAGGVYTGDEESVQ